MDFEYVELELPPGEAPPGRRVSSALVQSGYQSLGEEYAALVQRYLPGGLGMRPPADAAPGARTVDVLVPPASPSARILVCERAADSGPIVAVVAIGRSPEDAHRTGTAAKVAIDARGLVSGSLARCIVNDNGRQSAILFRTEWLRALGLEDRGDGLGPAGSSRPVLAAQVLRVLRGAPSVLDRPAVLRSRLEATLAESRVPAGPDTLESLATDGLVEKSFVLVCRQTGQVVGVGQDAADVQQAMRVALRCPHCRSPLRDELQDVLYSLSEAGAEFVSSTRWIRRTMEAALRRRGCEAFVLDQCGPGGRADGAACYQDTVLVFRLADPASGAEDPQAFLESLRDARGAIRTAAVRGVYVGDGSDAETAAGDAAAPVTVLSSARLEEGMDRLLREVERDNFARLTGMVVDLPRPHPGGLLEEG